MNTIIRRYGYNLLQVLFILAATPVIYAAGASWLQSGTGGMVVSAAWLSATLGMVALKIGRGALQRGSLDGKGFLRLMKYVYIIRVFSFAILLIVSLTYHLWMLALLTGLLLMLAVIILSASARQYC